MNKPTLIIQDIIEQNPMGSFQKLVMFFCALVIIFDGFDVLAIAFAAPAISTDLGLSKAQLGPVFSSGLVGMMIGALVLGPVGDKYGRRKAILLSVFVFGICTLLTGFASNFNELVLLRFLTGLGLGGAMPNVTALLTEYVSTKRRNIAIAVIFLGMPIGGISGGLISAEIIPVFGWESLFFVGGLMPLLILPLLIIWLPESPRFLIDHPKDSDKLLLKIAQKIEQRTELSQQSTFVHNTQGHESNFPIKSLFIETGARDTILIWCAFFLNLMVVYFLYTWIPTLLVNAGYGLVQATRTVVILNVGGALAPFIFAKAISKWGSKIILTSCFFLGAVSMLAIGQVADKLVLVMSLSFFAGFFIVGGQVSLNAFASYMYPPHIRATGVGWALGIGRAGSIVGPLLAGLLVMMALGLNTYFNVFGVLSLFTALSIYLISRHEKPHVTKG